MLSQQLRDQTKQNHQELEKALIPYLKNIRNKADYAKIVLLFYQYFGALEQEIDKYINSEILPDYDQRRKTDSLKIDLAQLNQEQPEILKNIIPDITNYYQALGALYVVEGSTLGGEIISKMIHNVLGDSIEPALSFFKGYGTDGIHMWEKFQNTLDSMSLTDTQRQEIIQTANKTFGRFHQHTLNTIS